MASPFKIFRKYSGGMMIIMVILSMLLFTLTDLFMDPSANLWLLGILIGGTVFGIAGVGQGRWLQWGLGGAVLGAALGFILPGFVEGTGLNTSLGVISQEDMEEMEMRRYVANQFVSRAMEESFGEGTARFATLFGFGHESIREDVIFGKLLRAEADRLGITVDETMVRDYLSNTMNEKLTKDHYIAARNAIAYQGKQLDDDTLVSVLADEIKARLAFLTLQPRTAALPPGPEVYWQYYRKLNVRQQLGLAAVDVDAFVDEVGEPTDAEVNEMFAKYATKRPNEEDRGSPGFRLPFRTQLAYIEVDAKSVENEVGEVTDEQIQKYYDENKETPLIKRPVIPDFDESETEKDEPAKQDADAEKEGEPADAKSDKAESKADADKPAADDAKKPAEPKPAEPAADKPASTEKPAADAAKPAEEAPAKPEPKPEPKPAPEEPKADEPETAKEEPSEPEDDSCGAFEPDETEADEPSSEETKEEAKADTADSKEAAPDEAATAETKADADEKTESAVSPAAADKPAALTIPDTPIITPGTSKTPEIPETQYEYRELDDELKAEIRDEIMRQRVQEAIDEKLSQAKAQMETIARDRSKERFSRIEKNPGAFEGTDEEKQEALRELRVELAPFYDELNDRLKAYAGENGLTYVETPMLSYSELIEEEDYPIGSATEPTENPMLAAQAPQVARTVFQSFSNSEQNNDAQLYLVREAVLRSVNLDGGEHHYVYWAVDFSPSHVPTLDEPGIREMVVLEWKRQKARDLASKRAKELAEQVRTGLAKEGEAKQDMAAALKGATVTGEENGTELAVRKTMPFSWLRTSSASPMSFQTPQATLSPIQFEDVVGGMLERVDERFMEAVFNDMKDEEVDVVPNVDLSQYYVVHVTNRFPTPEIGEDGLRERFANEGQQFAFARSPMVGVMQQQIAGPARLAWERDLWKKYGVDPDGEPQE